LRQTYGKCWYQPLTDRDQAALALRFTLGQGVTAALPPGEEPLFRMALDLASDLRPLTEAEQRQLAARAAGLHSVFSAVAAGVKVPDFAGESVPCGLRPYFWCG